MQASSTALLAPSRRPTDPAAHPGLIAALLDPRRYPGAEGAVELHETHISWVLLAGDFAYKVKKPVRLPFLDFSTLAARKRYCEEELRLNRRTAPDLYLDVVPITGSPADPRIGGAGPPIEYAVKMRRFAQEDLLRERARLRRLRPEDVDALAARVAELHAAAERVAGEGPSDHGPRAIDTAVENVDQALGVPVPGRATEALHRMRAWTVAEAHALAGVFAERGAGGFVRECHGDLHLGNAVLIDGAVALFDCIEFSPELRRTDVAADVAFASMDLRRLGLPRAASRFVNRYLEITGDYGMLRVLRFYEVYRALVRAKVAALRAAQLGGAAAHAALQEHHAHIALACAISRRPAPMLVLMHGLSGSGKTTAAERIAEAMGGIRLRSDVERKRLHGIAASTAAPAAPGAGIYGPRDSHDTYERLADLARLVLLAGYPAIVDATFLRAGDRRRFAELAEGMGAGFQIAACTAPGDVLRARVRARAATGRDASDAGIEVLEAQLAHLEPLSSRERVHATFLDTHAGAEWKTAAESLARRFASGYAAQR